MGRLVLNIVGGWPNNRWDVGGGILCGGVCPSLKLLLRARLVLLQLLLRVIFVLLQLLLRARLVLLQLLLRARHVLLQLLLRARLEGGTSLATAN